MDLRNTIAIAREREADAGPATVPGKASLAASDVHQLEIDE
jgi:hypothetical protein